MCGERLTVYRVTAVGSGVSVTSYDPTLLDVGPGITEPEARRAADSATRSSSEVSVRQVKAARALIGWTQRDLAAAAGVASPTIARLEAKVALNTILDRLPEVRLDPDGDDPHWVGWAFRSPTSVPVLFSAS